MKGVPSVMLDAAALTGWSGCASLCGDDPRLWVTKGTRCGEGESQNFSLAEVIEAGLRAKIVGLDGADVDGVIADCVADTLEQLRDLL
ncbi:MULTISPECIES: hypothetical protein [pseudomallei group]|uniref:hypothetical protein n=1 Tax=pseudomallei group TaxID=111527 RepID=UPI000F0E74D4|nr:MULTISPECIES: hypothetical protein [pseudomallei group]MCS6496727.1 hypothetical protein [Burkholderia thailandensis]VBQ36342.1 Uncharacterised protein [Burkholderia pseudomallei]